MRLKSSMQDAKAQLQARGEIERRLTAMKKSAQALLAVPTLVRDYALVNEDGTMTIFEKNGGWGLEMIPADLEGVTWLTLKEAAQRAGGWNSLLMPEQLEAGCAVHPATRKTILLRIIELCDMGLSQIRSDA